MKLNLDHLNSEQRKAVLHGDGPLLLLAGAGSGKTSTMTYRIAHLITERKVPAGAVLGLSFTNKAARELKDRVKGLVGKVAGAQAAQKLTITTFHSLCVRFLREHADKLGYQKNFSILDQNDQEDLVRGILRRIKIDDRKFDPRVILFQIGKLKNAGGVMGKLTDDYQIATASAFEHYQEQLKALNAMDFDDLLYQAVNLLENFPEVREQYGKKYRYILVDEYQDTNSTQFRLLELLTQKNKNICVVGDDDQSIYAWRGADPTHILGFRKHFPGAEVITLDRNYRSTTTILEAANKVIAKNAKRHPKKLWSDRGEGEPLTQIITEDDRDEADHVAEELLSLAKKADKQLRPWSDFAILYRSNAQSRVFEEALRMRGIPYKLVGGMSFLDRKEIKDILCYWRLTLNPGDDTAIRRVINWPARGIGKTAMQAVQTVAVSESIPFFQALAQAPQVAPRAAAGAAAFRGLIAELKRRLDASPPTPQGIAEWARESLDLIGARQGLEQDSDEAAQIAKRWENIEELAHSIGQIKIEELAPAGKATPAVLLREFLTRLILEATDEEDEEKDRKRDEVTLLTLHSAKGLEFPIVFLVGMEEGLLPHQRVIDEATDLSEERRLCYVGITRAKDRLFLTRAKTRIRWGKALPRTPTRFLEEIPKNLLLTRDVSSTPDLSSKEALEQHEEKVKGFLDKIRANL